MTLQSKIPPAVQVFFWAFVANILGRYFPLLELPSSTPVVAISAITGVIFLIVALADFRKHETTINPLDVSKATCLVTDGLYRITGNPMYVGLAFLLLAWCFYLAELVVFATVPLFLITLTVLQIKAEESAYLPNSAMSICNIRDG